MHPSARRNPIDRKTFEKVRKDFGWCASWAVWSPPSDPDRAKSDIGNLSVFGVNELEHTLTLLHADVIFVGLNFSRNPDIPDFANFHSPLPSGQDYKLRHALTGTVHWGAYLTDIIKGCVELKAADLMKRLRNQDNLEKENVETFCNEIKLLGAKDPLLVALGGHAHTLLQRNLKNKFRIVQAMHYSAYVNPEAYRECVLRQIAAAPARF